MTGIASQLEHIVPKKPYVQPIAAYIRLLSSENLCFFLKSVHRVLTVPNDCAAAFRDNRDGTTEEMVNPHQVGTVFRDSHWAHELKE